MLPCCCLLAPLSPGSSVFFLSTHNVSLTTAGACMTTSTTGDVVFRGALTGISHAQSVFLPAPSDSRVCSSITKQLRHITTKKVTHNSTSLNDRHRSSCPCEWIADMYHIAASMPPNTNWIDSPDGPDRSLLEPNAGTRKRIATRFDRKVPLERRTEPATSWKLSEIALLIGSTQRRHCNDRHVG